MVAVFSDNTTAMAYLHRQGGNSFSRTQVIGSADSSLGREREKISICSQFVPGRNNVVADAFSRPSQVVGTEWTLHQEVFDSLRKRWPVVIDLFASSLNHCYGVYFAPVSDPMAAGTDAMLQSWDHLLGYAFPPFAMIPQVLRKLRESSVAAVTLGRRSSGSQTFWNCSWNLLSFCQRGGTFCGSLTFAGINIIYPCFVFMRGDYPEVCASLRTVC